ncbi:MAG: phage terminase small subunit P27 family [Terrimicrobiaceae bacterium]
MGRQPKPTALKKLQGNPGKRPLNENEPRPVPNIPGCPSHIVGPARKEWKRLTAELFTQGLLTSLDRAALAGYCAAYGRWVEAEKAIRKDGLTMVTPNGFLVQTPYVGIANKSVEQMCKFAAQFGMTPASRSKIKIGSAPEEDPFETFVRQQLGEKQT